MTDALRLALGTLTVFRVPPPRQVGRRTAGRAMLLAPAVGLFLGVPVALALWLLGRGSPAPLLAAVLAVAALALLTRGLHLDGLADTADGLGSGQPAQDALAVMRRGDVGPFGAATVVLVLLVQVAALQALLARGQGPAGLLVALTVSRLTLPLLCARGVPSARADGLGRTVAGSVPRGRLLAVTGAVALVAWALLGWQRGPDLLVSLAAVLLPLAVAAGLARRCVRRLGGVTGDVLGAGVELSLATCLVVLAIL